MKKTTKLFLIIIFQIFGIVSFIVPIFLDINKNLGLILLLLLLMPTFFLLATLLYFMLPKIKTIHKVLNMVFVLFILIYIPFVGRILENSKISSNWYLVFFIIIGCLVLLLPFLPQKNNTEQNSSN